MAAHQPEPREHPGLVMVGDYLFDSTLNGVLRSATLATTRLAAQLEDGLQATGTGWRPTTLRSPIRWQPALPNSMLPALPTWNRGMLN